MKKLLFLLMVLLPMVASADGVTCTYVESTHTLTISGNGAIDFRIGNGYENVQTVIIENGVTNIGTAAFWRCSSLTSVTIPNSVTSIGGSAFQGCTGLTTVTIPNSVTSIEAYAFSGCNGLTSVTIPNSVTSIGGHAFDGCWRLTRITIPNSVTNIGDGAFSGCSGLTSITVDEGNRIYDSRDNCNAIIETSTNKLICGCENTIIPNTVTSIGESAFYDCYYLQSIDIPSSVTSIGDDAFNGCCYLTSITVDEGNKMYDSRDNCNAIIETSTNKLIHGCYNTRIPNSVTSIGENAFDSCFGLTSVTIPNSVTSIGDGAFSDCKGLTSITIPNSVTSIGSSAFYGCSRLTSIIIPNSVTSIGRGAFDYTAWYNNQPDGIVYVVKVAYTYKGTMPSNTSIVLEEGTLGIADWAFWDCSGLTSISIPNSVTSIGDDAFAHCTGLSSVTIPNSVTSIGSGAFWNCTGLTSVTIPNSMTSISSSAFDGCSGLMSVTIPNSVTSIGSCAFLGCSSLTSVSIPNSVTSIGSVAFLGCSGLTSVTIPNSVTSIEDEAFEDCSGLTSVTIPNSVTSIGGSAFQGCTGLTTVTIPNSVTSIGWSAFDACYSLTSVTMESITPTEIAEYTFTNRANATLYVPYGSKEAYKSAEFWKDFKEIVELEPDYDLSNKLVVSDVSVVKDGTVTLPISMENENEITAFQFELEVPDGMTVSDATLTSRKSNQTLTYNLLDNGRYRFVAFSSNSQSFSGSEGALVNVLLKAGGTMTAGEYTIEVKNIELTTTSEEACKPANCSATLTVSNIKAGDANGDGNISITDAVAVVNYLLNRPSTSFRADAADLTGDGNITITDAVAIVNIVLGKRPANARMREPQ